MEEEQGGVEEEEWRRGQHSVGPGLWEDTLIPNQVYLSSVASN